MGGIEKSRKVKVQVHLSGVSRKEPKGCDWKDVLAALGSCCGCLLAYIHRLVLSEFLWFCNFLEQSSLNLEQKLKRKLWQWEWSLIEDWNARISWGQQKSGVEECMNLPIMGQGWMSTQEGLGMFDDEDGRVRAWKVVVWLNGRFSGWGAVGEAIDEEAAVTEENTNVWVSDSYDMLSSGVWCPWWYAQGVFVWCYVWSVWMPAMAFSN